MKTGAILDVRELRRLSDRDGWREYSGNPVLEPGKAGEWDAGALGSMSVLKVGGTYHMYYEAWGKRGEEWSISDYETLQIGHAVSADGVHWTKDPHNPVLPKSSKAGDWDAHGTWDPFVLYEDGVFKMWYGGGVGDECDWGFAVSKNGTDFTKMGQISNLNHVEDCHVVHDRGAGRYYMYYWDRRHEPMGLFRAESFDERNFDFADAVNIRIRGEDYPGQYKFSYVFIEDGRWHMFYADFIRPHCGECYTRYAVSRDGLNFTFTRGGLVAGHDAEVVKASDRLYLMYYGPQGYFDAKDCPINLAVYAGNLNAHVCLRRTQR